MPTMGQNSCFSENTGMVQNKQKSALQIPDMHCLCEPLHMACIVQKGPWSPNMGRDLT